MSFTGWIIFFLIIQVVHFLGTWKLYQKAGRKPWEALIPIYNGIVLMQIINRPKWYVILLFVPIVNLLMFPVLWVETIRSFGKNKTLDTWLVLLTLGFYIYYLNYAEIDRLTYIEDRSLKPANGMADFVSSIVYAVIVATVIHTYFIQPFVIPSSSLEKTLLVGDFLLVSKVNYGARTPMTAVALPMVHDTIPLIPTSYEGLPKYVNRYKSYLKKPQIPYFRLPGFDEVKKNDIVVFNWPTDTVRFFFHDRTAMNIRKPIDKKSNYVKRCVGTAGDSIEVRNGDVYINGEILQLSYRAKPLFLNNIKLKEGNSLEVLSKYGVNQKDLFGYTYVIKASFWDDTAVKNYFANPKNQVHLTEQKRDTANVYASGYINNPDLMQRLGIQIDGVQANITIQQEAQLRSESNVASVERVKRPEGTGIFPQTEPTWSESNWGPIYIPKAGDVLELNKETLPFYRDIIREYENNDLKVIGDEILINNQSVTSYQVKQDYYWMMGDNRNFSEDSRYWGYVPADHIVGKPVFIWMSYDSEKGGVRWDRVFTTVGGDGEPKSYLRWFLIALGGYFVIDHFLKRRKKKKATDS
ncbi:MAG: signal peptidase I [Flavobacteriaceae bacterium]